jgi:hypothetical protein
MTFIYNISINDMAYIRGAGKIRRHEGLVYVDANLEKKANAMIASNSKKPIKT